MLLLYHHTHSFFTYSLSLRFFHIFYIIIDYLHCYSSFQLLFFTVFIDSNNHYFHTNSSFFFSYMSHHVISSSCCHQHFFLIISSFLNSVSMLSSILDILLHIRTLISSNLVHVSPSPKTLPITDIMILMIDSQSTQVAGTRHIYNHQSTINIHTQTTLLNSAFSKMHLVHSRCTWCILENAPAIIRFSLSCH